MILRDENFPESQRLLLRSWGIRARQIGLDIGSKGLSDAGIIPLLLRNRHSTLVTLDYDFYRRELVHSSYCLIVVNTGQVEAAAFTRRALNHSALNTAARRSGKVIRASQAGLVMWHARSEAEVRLDW